MKGPNDIEGMRRLAVVTSLEDPEHQCLVPIEGPENILKLLNSAQAFTCACGETFASRMETSGWATEYAPRCLKKSLKEHTDNRHLTNRPIA